MIDSLNLIILGVHWIEFNNLMKLGVKFIGSFDEFNYTYTKKTFRFAYKGIEFKYNKEFKYLLLMAKPKIVLKKRDITLSDKTAYKESIHQIVSDVLGTTYFEIFVSRIDFCVDLKVDDRMEVYISLLNRHRDRFRFMEHMEYDTSSYLKSKSGKGEVKLNFYERFAKTGDPKDKGILRLEVQIFSPKIKKELDKNNVAKIIDVWWSTRNMNIYYFLFLKKYLYVGNYYKRNLCKKLIDKSNLPKFIKKRLNKFSLFEKRYKIDGLINDRKKFCDDTVIGYIERLNELEINPVTIPDNAPFDTLENLLKLARKTSVEKYFK